MQVIYSVEMLGQLMRLWTRLVSVRSLPDIVLDLPELSAPQNDAVSQLINSQKKVCGCYAAVAGAVISAAWLLFNLKSLSSGLSSSVLIACSAIVLSVFLASKLLAVAWARIRMLAAAQMIIWKSRKLKDCLSG